jgi:hypothetical protein
MQAACHTVGDRVRAPIDQNYIALPTDHGLHHRIEGSQLPRLRVDEHVVEHDDAVRRRRELVRPADDD